MKLKVCIAFILACLSSVTIDAQSFIFGPKLGPVVGLQQWNGRQLDPLLAGHLAFFIESFEEENPSSLFAQLGFHQRGSAERSLVVDRSLGDIFRRNITYKFNNVSLMLGAKRLLKMDVKAKPFYTLGVRMEYTLSTNLDRYEGTAFQTYFPSNFFVNKLNYGFSAGGGFQYQFGDLIGGTVELTISPDISKQYEQFPIDVVDPRNVGQSRTLPQQNVRNLSLEIGVSLRLLRKVEYY